jgi:hypothetical protein
LRTLLASRTPLQRAGNATAHQVRTNACAACVAERAAAALHVPAWCRAAGVKEGETEGGGEYQDLVEVRSEAGVVTGDVNIMEDFIADLPVSRAQDARSMEPSVGTGVPNVADSEDGGTVAGGALQAQCRTPPSAVDAGLHRNAAPGSIPRESPHTPRNRGVLGALAGKLPDLSAVLSPVVQQPGRTP